MATIDRMPAWENAVTTLEAASMTKTGLPAASGVTARTAVTTRRLWKRRAGTCTRRRLAAARGRPKTSCPSDHEPTLGPLIGCKIRRFGRSRLH
jgi:hypothetical protein